MAQKCSCGTANRGFLPDSFLPPNNIYFFHVLFDCNLYISYGFGDIIAINLLCKQSSAQLIVTLKAVLSGQFFSVSLCIRVHQLSAPTLAKGSKLGRSCIYQCMCQVSSLDLWLTEKVVHLPISKISLMTIDPLNMTRVESGSGNA